MGGMARRDMGSMGRKRAENLAIRKRTIGGVIQFGEIDALIRRMFENGLSRAVDRDSRC
jgi:hypothetical protein